MRLPAQLVLVLLFFLDSASAVAGSINTSLIESTTVTDEKGNTFGVQKSSLKLVSHSPLSVYKSVDDARKKRLIVEREKEECSRMYDPYTCSKLFPDQQDNKDISLLPKLSNLPKLSINPVYITIQFNPSLTNPEGHVRIGKTQSFNCLNPRMPRGYWPHIDSVRGVLKSVPSPNSKSNVDRLKRQMCDKAMGLQ